MPKRFDFKTEAEWLEHLRFWFAGMALQGLCSNEVITRPRPQTKEFIEFAKVCYDYADGMLAELQKGTKP